MWANAAVEELVACIFYKGVRMQEVKEYTAFVSFYINVNAENQDIAKRALLNTLQFRGHVVAELDVKIIGNECPKCEYRACVCNPVIKKQLPNDE